MRKMIPFDYTTINLSSLRNLPEYHNPGNHTLQGEDHAGNSCFLDAPGYPTYYTRSVYNSGGNPLPNGPYMVITDPENRDTHYVVDDVDLRSLWVPLPYGEFEHEGYSRLYIWMRSVYHHLQHCYADPAKGAEYRHARNLKISSNWQGKDLNYHAAVLAIRDFYPEHEPNTPWIDKPEWAPQNDWWERYATLVTVKPGQAAAYEEVEG